MRVYVIPKVPWLRWRNLDWISTILFPGRVRGPGVASPANWPESDWWKQQTDLHFRLLIGRDAVSTNQGPKIQVSELANTNQNARDGDSCTHILMSFTLRATGLIRTIDSVIKTQPPRILRLTRMNGPEPREWIRQISYATAELQEFRPRLWKAVKGGLRYDSLITALDASPAEAATSH